MNQIAASILILSASICGYASAVRPVGDGLGGLMSLIALGVGLWGGLALLTSTTRERELYLDEMSSETTAPRAGIRRLQSTVQQYVPRVRDSVLGAASRDYRLTPETAAQVTMAAQLNGRSRTDVVEDILNQNLPRYTSGRVA